MVYYREPHPDDGDIFLQATCELAEAVGVAAGYLKQIPNHPMYFKVSINKLNKLLIQERINSVLS